jgi:glycosyltransferase involved in cell wall biosynthesis
MATAVNREKSLSTTSMIVSRQETQPLSCSELSVGLCREARPEKRGVLIYAPHLLPMGQGYVREHAERLRRYRPVLAGRRQVQGTSIGDFPSFTIGAGRAGRLREFRFLLAGIDAALIDFIRRHRINLIHAHFGPGGAEIMRVAALLGIPLIVTLHGWDVKLDGETHGPVSCYERVYRRRLQKLLSQSSAIVCVSSAWRDRAIAIGCHPEKVRTNYLGVDSGFFDGVRGQFDPRSIIYVGRLIRRKGVHNLLEAVRLLRGRGIEVHLTVVGEGPESDGLRRTAAERNLPVRFLGKRNRYEIRELLRRTAVLCAPSTSFGGESPEALGLVLLEAQAMSVPVVATRNGGIPETLEDGRTGYLVDQDSPSTLASALARLLDNESLNRSFGWRARAFVCDRFDINRCYGALEDLYDRYVPSIP